MRRASVVVTRALLAATVVLVACAQNQAQVRATGDADRESSVQEHRLEVPDDASALELALDVDTSAGEVSWAVRDPAGAIVEDGPAEPGARVERTLALQPQPGAWELRLDLRGATGSYDIRLRTSW